jgi:hypothetical protein
MTFPQSFLFKASSDFSPVVLVPVRDSGPSRPFNFIRTSDFTKKTFETSVPDRSSYH